MKTLVMFIDTGAVDSVEFFELEGDYSHLDDVFINSTDNQEKVQELLDIVYDEEGNFKPKTFKEPTKDWDKYIRCGFIA